MAENKILTTGPATEDEKEKAYADIKVWLNPGLGTKASVEEYSKAGKKYDEHMDTLNFHAPTKMAETAASILKDFKNAKILDAGAGSGLGGVELQKLGYTNIDAVDAASGLLELAESRNVYSKIMCQFLGSEPLPVEDGTYDMVTMSGAVGENMLPAEAFDDLIRVIKPGGHLVNVFREPALSVPYYGDGLEQYFQNLEKMGKWKQLDKIYFPNFLAGVEGVVFIHQVM